jgi:hypothetical protein
VDTIDTTKAAVDMDRGLESLQDRDRTFFMVQVLIGVGRCRARLHLVWLHVF